MMHAFMQLNDGTEIVHSDILYDENGQEYVKVYMESLLCRVLNPRIVFYRNMIGRK